MGRKKTTIEEFINRAKLAHGDRYDYSKLVYINNKTNVEVVCRKHGSFWKDPNHHMNGAGCPKCTAERLSLERRSTKGSFVEKARSVHGDKYDYDLVDYKNNHTKVVISCLEHGPFKQSPNRHLDGQGCPVCAEFIKGWTSTKWREAGENSTQFDSFKVYVIECWSDSERFYKIGKTFRKVSKRFNSSVMPYEWELVEVYEGSAKAMSELEKDLHKKYKDYEYVPDKFFEGMRECFLYEIKYKINVSRQRY